ncbi:hypothetical protein GCM10011608_49450 [Micromonospora sonchi]|uniref:Uncharacterized protein n=1 Tax=Micromonospora sonchi TaxID=1763543 RepID=A0A917X2Z4_9ACTN|nr:hypothetical protein GCM10011608_49450 [Micromonospora sonchi]
MRVVGSAHLRAELDAPFRRVTAEHCDGAAGQALLSDTAECRDGVGAEVWLSVVVGCCDGVGVWLSVVVGCRDGIAAQARLAW